MGKGLSKWWNLSEDPASRTISSVSNSMMSKGEELKMKKFRDKIDAIKENNDEYLGLQIIEEALLDYKVCYIYKQLL
jgi:hypothetical protein